MITDGRKRISFIIPVKNKDNDRIQRCVDSLKSKWTREIIIIDYNSERQIKDIEGATIFRYTKNKIWNKAHAINIGIKMANSKYIGTVDCDMIIHPMFIETAMNHIDKETFIYSKNIRRIKRKNIDDSFFKMKLNSEPWAEGGDKRHIEHNKDDGIQIYCKTWINSIHGLDESLIYWGGMDNDTSNRALLSGLVMIDINLPILHQEHRSKKEKNLTEEERINAFKISVEKTKYLNKMFANKIVRRNNGGWGGDLPNQQRFLMWMRKKEAYSKSFNNVFVRVNRRGDAQP